MFHPGRREQAVESSKFRIGEPFAEFKCFEIPIRLAVDHIAVEAGSNSIPERSDGALWLRSSHPKSSRRRTRFAARHKSGKDRRTCGIVRARVDFAKRSEFWCYLLGLDQDKQCPLQNILGPRRFCRPCHRLMLAAFA
jgi:hypothetical protein